MSLKHLQEIKDSIGLDEFKARSELKREKRRRQKKRRKLKKNPEISTSQVETVGSKVRNVKEVEIVTYSSRRKKENGDEESKVESEVNEADGADTDELSMKSARFDVFKFGVKGLSKAGQEEARVALAVSLGAKPQKNKCLPYKEYKEKARAEREERRQQWLMAKSKANVMTTSRTSSVISKPKKTQKKKKSGGSGGDFIPKMGKLDKGGGILRISQKDIQKINKKK